MRNILSLVLLLIPSYLALSQGVLKESLSLKSQILGKEVEYSVYFPPDYEISSRRYPVLYLLHGYSDDETGWTQFGEVKAIADRQLSKDEMTSMIIVMPDAGISWYINSYDGKVLYEDFFVKELIPFIDTNYRTRTDRQYRAVAGLSMGGHGTLVLSMKHPDLFSTAAPLSAAVWTDAEVTGMPEENWGRGIGLVYGKDLKGKDRLGSHFQKNSGIGLVNSLNADDLKKVRYYIDCGDKDFLIKGNMALHAAMIDKKIPHEFRVRQGVHDWTYWRTALPEVFRFVSESFHR
ncbi:MAG: alpha/beta hydrolase [Cyclobacteriaceae bacterium]